MALDGAALILGLITAFVAYLAWNEWDKYQAIRNTPRSTVRSIAMGLTELHGTITADKPLEAPLTGKECVAYTYKIEEHHHDDDGSDWHTIKQGNDQATASLTDDTGTVTVDLNGVSIEQGTTWQEDSSTWDDPPKNVEKHLESLDVDHEGWLGMNKRMRYTETRINHGDQVYLLGTARDNPDVEDGTAANSTDDIIIEEANDQFMIATGDESSLRSNKQWAAYGLVALSAVLTIGTLTYIIAA
jgi:hypothetical protein